MDEDAIIKAAKERDVRYANKKPLSIIDGVPISVKDMIYIKDHVNYNGKSPLEEHADGHVSHYQLPLPLPLILPLVELRLFSSSSHYSL